jgi:hypothetical protein
MIEYTVDMTMRQIAFYLIRVGSHFEFNGFTYQKIRRTQNMGKWFNAVNIDTTEFEWFEDSVQVYV